MRTDALRSAGQELRDDRRGAVLLIAVFMAVFLVGCLWYLVGVGDAAIYREKMQDGSDAVAFASAVYHARGMNIIAVLNLIMAAALAVLIAFKVAQLLAVMVAAIATALCPWTAATCPIAAQATTIATDLQTSVIPNVQKVVDTILKACSASEKWVAELTPWVGAARSVIASQSYTPTVTGGVALSMSMVPSGDRLGLPVQEEPFDKLCARAGTMLANLGFGWIPGFSLVGSLFGKLVGTFPGYFCGGSSGGVSATDQTQTIQEQCTQAEQQYNTANQNNPNAKPFDMKQCQNDAAKALQQSGGTTTSGVASSSTSGETSKMIFASAQNGDDYFQVYGFVTGDNTSAQKNSKKAVEMPAWGKASIQTNAVADALEKTSFSQAEFYYDQVTSGKLAWSDYKDDALWNMRWRARLRRFRLPTQTALGSLAGLVGSVPGVPSSLSGAASGWASNAASAINSAVGAVVIH